MASMPRNKQVAAQDPPLATGTFPWRPVPPNNTRQTQEWRTLASLSQCLQHPNTGYLYQAQTYIIMASHNCSHLFPQPLQQAPHQRSDDPQDTSQVSLNLSLLSAS